MVTPDDIRLLRTAAVDHVETEKLKAEFARLRASRKPFFLNADDLEKIFRWKLRGQYSRNSELRRANPANVYEIVTRACFEVCSDVPSYEANIRLKLLTAIAGVGVPVASAILALVDPDNYCVVDFRGWRAMFNEDRREFSISHYLRYLEKVRPLASELAWSVQETDLAIWALDMKRNNKAV